MYNLIIYDTKYGNTKKVVDILEKIIGYSKTIRVDEFKERYRDIYDNFIFVSPVYIEKLLPSIEKFIEENKTWLKEKDVYSVVINMIGEKGINYLNKVEKSLEKKFVMKFSLYGEIKINNLSKADYKGLKFFGENIGTKLNINNPFDNLNLYDEKAVVKVALKMKREIENRRKALDRRIIEMIVFNFIKEKNTCVLATGYENTQRATPLEYIFYKNYLYFISEGGEKFASFYRNENASVGIYNEFEGFNKLCGVQIKGVLEEVKFKGKEYFKIMDLKNINKEALETLPVNLYILKLQIKKIEAIHSEFKKYGGIQRQVLKF